MNLTHKHFFIVIFLYFSIDVKAELTGQDSVDLLQQWQYEFNRYLIKHDNPNLRAYGVYFLSYEEDEAVLTEMIKTLSDLSSLTGLSDQSFALLTASCQEERLLDLCNELALFDKYMSHYPENLNAYFFPLERALKTNDKSTINNIIINMSKATFINEWLNYSNEFDEALTFYAHAFPFPKQVIDFEINDMKKRNRFSKEKEKYLSVNMSDYLLLIIKIGIDMVMPAPNYKSLTDVCENKSHNFSCLEIAEILINKSRTLMSKIFGYKLKINIFNKMDKNPESELVTIQLTSFRAKYNCLNDMAYTFSVFDMNITNEKARQKVSHNQGEFAGLYHFAKLKYKELQKADHKNVETHNPDLCLQEN